MGTKREDPAMTRTRSLNWFLALGVVLGLGLTGVGTAFPQSYPADLDQAGQQKLAQLTPDAMRSGIITAKSIDSVDIDGQAYRLHPNATFFDGAGGRMKWESFSVGGPVKFHLTKDGKVDMLVALDSPG